MSSLLNFKPLPEWKPITEYYNNFKANLKYSIIGNNNNTYRVALIKNNEIPSQNLDDFLNSRSIEIGISKTVSYLHKPNESTLFIKNITTKEQLEVSLIEGVELTTSYKDTIYLFFKNDDSGGGVGSVNGVLPDINGNVEITGDDIKYGYEKQQTIKEKIDEIEQHFNEEVERIDDKNNQQDSHLLSIDNTLEKHNNDLTELKNHTLSLDNSIEKHNQQLEHHSKHLLAIDRTLEEQNTEINRLQIPFLTYRTKKECDIKTDWAVLNGDKVKNIYIQNILKELINGKYRYISESEWLNEYNLYNGYVDAFAYTDYKDNPTYIRKPNIYDYDYDGDVGNSFTRTSLPTTEATAITIKRDCYIYVASSTNNSSKNFFIKRKNSNVFRIVEYVQSGIAGSNAFSHAQESTYLLRAGDKIYGSASYELREVPIDRTTKYVMYFDKGYNDNNDDLVSLLAENYPILPKREEQNQQDYIVDTDFLTSIFNLETRNIFVNINGQTKEIVANGELKLVKGNIFKWQGQDVKIDLQTLPLIAVNHTSALFNNSIKDNVFNNKLAVNTKYQYQSTLKQGYIKLNGVALVYEADGRYSKWEGIIPLEVIRGGANTKQFITIGDNYLYYEFIELDENIMEIVVDIPYTKLDTPEWKNKLLNVKFRNATTGLTMNTITYDNNTTKGYYFNGTDTINNNSSWTPTNVYVNFAILSSNNTTYTPTTITSKGQTFIKRVEFIARGATILTYGGTATCKIDNTTYYQLGDKFDTLGINDGFFNNTFSFDIKVHYYANDNLSDDVIKEQLITAGTNNKLNRIQDNRAFRLEAMNGSTTNTILLQTSNGATDTMIKGDIPDDLIFDEVI